MQKMTKQLKNSGELLSIIMPIYNEEKTVETILEKIACAPCAIAREVIIVNDGSTDKSREKITQVISRLSRSDCEMFLFDKENGGKGSALQYGIARSKGSIVIIQDGDLEYDPNDYDKCIEPIRKGETFVVYGSREQENRNRFYSAPSFYLGGLLLSFFVDILYGAALTDEPTCYKTFAGDLIRSIPAEGEKFDWEVEVTSRLLRMGFSIKEVPISYYPRKLEEGKKIRAKDGFMGFLTALKWRFFPLPEKKILTEKEEFAPTIRKNKKYQFLLWGILLAAILVRGLAAYPAFTESLRKWNNPQQARYERECSFQQKYFCNYSREKGSFHTFILNKAPLVPAFLSLFAPAGTKAYIWTGLVLLLLGAGISLILYEAGKMLGSPPAGLAAAALFAFAPPAVLPFSFFGHIEYGTLLLVFLAALQYGFFFNYLKTGFAPFLAASAFAGALGALALTSNAFWFFPGGLLILLSGKLDLRRKIVHILLLLLITASVLFPFLLRNRVSYGAWRLDGSRSERLFLAAMLVEIKVNRNNFKEKMDAILQEVWEKSSKKAAGKTPDAGSYYTGRDLEMIKLLASHPFTFAKTLFNKHAISPLSEGLFRPQINFLQSKLAKNGERPAYRKLVQKFNHIITVLAYGIWLLVILGLAWFAIGEPLKGKGMFTALTLLLLAGYYLLESGAVQGFRCQLPALPLLYLAAGWGLAFFFGILKAGKEEEMKRKALRLSPRKS